MIEKKQEPIDFQKIALVLWANRKFIAKVCAIMLAIAVVYAYSKPRGYSSSVTLAPEMSSSDGIAGGISSLASIAGINLGGSSEDAIYPEIYPDLVSSPQFLYSLFDVRVKTSGGDVDTTLYCYLTQHQKHPWWGVAVVGVKKLIKSIISKPESTGGGGETTAFWLSERENEVCEAIKGCTSCSVDKKTGVISIGFSAQDPLVAASVTDSIKQRLQEYIIAYRTSKARNDLKYMENLCAEARTDYIEAQQEYADFCDQNTQLYLQSYAVKKSRLQSDLSIAEAVYTQLAQQVQLAKAKVQEVTPAFTVVSVAVVPLKPSSPKRLFIMIGFVMLGFMGSSFYVYVKDQLNATDKS